MRRTTRALSMCAVVPATLGLSGCVAPWYGMVQFHDHGEGHANGGNGVTDEITTYTVDRGGAVASVTSTFDSWSVENDPITDEMGCAYTTTHWYGAATRTGTVYFQPADSSSLVVGLIPSSVDATYPVTVERLGCGLAPFTYQATFATRAPTNPEVLVSQGGREIQLPDGGWSGWQDDCPVYQQYDTSGCLVAYDLHPQTAAPASVK
jgi:hypothetical protein